MTTTAPRRAHPWFRWTALVLVLGLALFYVHRALTTPDPELRHQLLVEGFLLYLPVFGASLLALACWPWIIRMGIRGRLLVGGAVIALPLVADAVAWYVLEWRDRTPSVESLLLFGGIVLGAWALERSSREPGPGPRQASGA